MRISDWSDVCSSDLADQGFLVLSVDNLTYEDIVGRQKTAEERTAAFNRDFAGRKHILSAIESAIEILADRNLVAKDRIGITGLSDGCTTAKFEIGRAHV